MEETYRVGIIGRTGHGNYGHGLDTVWAEVPQTQVVALADDDETGRTAAAKRTGAQQTYADFREMLEKHRLDIVAVAPRWIDRHHELLMACIEHGCHIYMEKPFVPTLEQADEIVRACEMRHVKLAIAHQTRYSSVAHQVKSLIENDEIGQVLEVRARGKEDRRGGGEDLWVLGTHLMDLKRLFFGDCADCFARVSLGGRPVTKADVKEGNEGIGPLAGDGVHAVYSFDNGPKAFFASHRGQAGSPSRFGLRICGSKGLIEVFTGFMNPAYLLKDSSWSPGRSGAKWQTITSAGIDQPEPRKDAGLHAGNVAAVRDLIEAIETDRPPLGSVYDARSATEMIVAVFESHRLGRP
ncbi:MAG: Gfo/Idh/MocA family protein, partial [Planctomycetaceae bacterium]